MLNVGSDTCVRLGLCVCLCGCVCVSALTFSSSKGLCSIPLCKRAC